MKLRVKKLLPFALLLLVAGCTVVSANRVFPKVSFYWSEDAELERMYRRQHAAYEAGNTNWMNVK